jgi:hypothetical protein
MANEPAALVDVAISDGTVTEENMESFINRELVGLLRVIRERLNETLERPPVPIFATFPVTDADFDPIGNRPPVDGVFAFSSGDGRMYIRVSGAFVAIP